MPTFFSIALRGTVLLAIIAGVVALTRSTRAARETTRLSTKDRIRTSFRAHPLKSAFFLLPALIFFVVGPLGILYYLLFPSTFTPSSELRSFSKVMLFVAAAVGLAFGTLLLWQERGKLLAKDVKLGQRLTLWLLPISCPVFFALFCMMFAAGPLSYALHLLADKATMSQVERNVKGGRSTVSDFTCGGFWTAELHDHAFWWPRRVCGLDLQTKRALDTSGSITLTGTVSRFGIDVQTYSASPR